MFTWSGIRLPVILIGSALLWFGLASCQSETERLHVFNINTPQELKEFFRYSEDRGPLVNTHRGGMREGFPENAIETMENTIRHTWSIMEVDPRYTKDSVAVLFHDRTLDRTSTGSGNILDYTYEELLQLRLIDPFGNVTNYRIPTLDEALEWARGKTILFLDDKDVTVDERVRFIQEHEAQSYAVLMAYSFEDARRTYELDPDITMQVFMPDSDAVARFDETGVPWENVVAFVTHQYQPADENVIDLINERGAMAVMGTSRTIDQEYLREEIGIEELFEKYRELTRQGVDIIEADLGIEAGKALEEKRAAGAGQEYFIYSN